MGWEANWMTSQICSGRLCSGKKTGVDSAPSQKTRAMQRAQVIETTLSDKRIVLLIDLFQNDVTVADAYLAITRDGVRKKWVEARTCDIMEDEEDIV